MKFSFLIVRVNSFTEIDNRNFNKKLFSTIKNFFNKIVELISKSKDDANSNAHESLFYKQKNKVRLDVKI